MYGLQQKLKMLKLNLKHWKKNVFGNILKAKKVLEQEMEKTQQHMILQGRTKELVVKEGLIQTQLEEQEIQEETYWKQKERVNWLKEGGCYRLKIAELTSSGSVALYYRGKSS